MVCLLMIKQNSCPLPTFLHFWFEKCVEMLVSHVTACTDCEEMMRYECESEVLELGHLILWCS